jgi:hypothetical protein
MMAQHIMPDNRASVLLRRYKERLVTTFRAMSREEQEVLIRKNSTAVTVGVCILLVNGLYALIPALLRVFLIPVIVVGSYFVGRQFVSPLVIKRLEPHLKQPQSKIAESDDIQVSSPENLGR